MDILGIWYIVPITVDIVDIVDIMVVVVVVLNNVIM